MFVGVRSLKKRKNCCWERKFALKLLFGGFLHSFQPLQNRGLLQNYLWIKHGNEIHGWEVGTGRKCRHGTIELSLLKFFWKVWLISDRSPRGFKAIIILVLFFISPGSLLAALSCLFRLLKLELICFLFVGGFGVNAFRASSFSSSHLLYDRVIINDHPSAF